MVDLNTLQLTLRDVALHTARVRRSAVSASDRALSLDDLEVVLDHIGAMATALDTVITELRKKGVL